MEYAVCKQTFITLRYFCPFYVFVSTHLYGNCVASCVLAGLVILYVDGNHSVVLQNHYVSVGETSCCKRFFQ